MKLGSIGHTARVLNDNLNMPISATGVVVVTRNVEIIYDETTDVPGPAVDLRVGTSYARHFQRKSYCCSLFSPVFSSAPRYTPEEDACWSDLRLLQKSR
jgi:hypothetical protein